MTNLSSTTSSVKAQHPGDSHMHWVQLQGRYGHVMQCMCQTQGGGTPVGANLQNAQVPRILRQKWQKVGVAIDSHHQKLQTATNADE